MRLDRIEFHFSEIIHSKDGARLHSGGVEIPGDALKDVSMHTDDPRVICIKFTDPTFVEPFFSDIQDMLTNKIMDGE